MIEDRRKEQKKVTKILPQRKKIANYANSGLSKNMRQ